MKVGIIGLGKLGLGFSTFLLKNGHDVIGYDINQNRVDEIYAATKSIDSEKGNSKIIDKAIKANKFSCSINVRNLAEKCQVIVICVPLFLDKKYEPDLSNLENAVENLTKSLRNGVLIILETTAPVGTTRQTIVKQIEINRKWKVGIDFFVAFSPERVRIGRMHEDLLRYPKIIGASDTKSRKKAEVFFNKILKKHYSKSKKLIILDSLEDAEYVKLAETTYRDVNLALANEFLLDCFTKGINFKAVVEAANSQPYSYIHDGGISVGGHCIPVYPHLLMSTNKNFELPKKARNINRNFYLKIFEESGLSQYKNKNILILGLSYRENVKESHNSGAFEIYNYFAANNPETYVDDPLYSEGEIRRLNLKPYTDKNKISFELVVIHTVHDKWPNLKRYSIKKDAIILDGRGHFKNPKSSSLKVINIFMNNK
jgi:UDP-N-acetyl-D-glucosamine dehydrogenase